MLFWRKLLILCMLFVTINSGSTFAQSASKFEFSTIERKPFAFQIDGEWNGFTIELWGLIIERIGGDTRYVGNETFPQMLNLVERSVANVAGANISITAGREEIMDFSQPIFDAGLLIMTRKEEGSSLLSAIWNPQLMKLLLAAIVLFIIAGWLIGYLERKHKHFDTTEGHSRFGEGVWWAVSVVTNASFTIFTPMTIAGRMVAYGLIIVGLFVVSAFVAQITSTLTVKQLNTQVNSINDLRSKRIGTTTASTSSKYLTRQALDHKTFDKLSDLYAALEDNKIDAVVHDAPILAYYVKTEGSGKFETNGSVFNPEQYGFIFPEGSGLRENVNRELLRIRESGEYEELVRRWFGRNYQ